jgi:hypothetical protein
MKVKKASETMKIVMGVKPKKAKLMKVFGETSTHVQIYTGSLY